MTLILEEMSPRPTAARRVLATSPFNRAVADIVVYEIDDWVSHDRYGLGRVVGGQPGIDVVADFRGGGVLRITLPSTKLAKI